MNNEQIASLVSMTSKFLDGHLDGASIPDKFVARCSLISQLTFDVAQDETPEIAIRMLGQQVTIFLEECDPATRIRLLMMIAKEGAEQMGMNKGDQKCE